MNKKICLSIVLLLLLSASHASSADGVRMQIEVSEYDYITKDKVLIYADTVSVVKDISATGFIGPFSMDIETVDIDSIKAVFNIHLVTLSLIAQTQSRNFTVEYGLPAEIDDIKGKNNSKYSLVLTPLERSEIDTASCAFNHRRKNDFTFQPTAYTDLYYVESSLGDFNWASMKEIIESQYRQFMEFANITLPGKILVFMYPCPSYAIIWDRKFGMAYDPTRNAAYAIYNKNLNTTDPFVVIHTAVLRNFGYSSPFMSEGLANYFSFAPYEIKLLKKDNQLLKIKDILKTYDYYHSQGYAADRISATFVKYLVDTYGFETFMKAYKEADDLNLSGVIEKKYEKSIDQLESEWLNYIDTLTIQPMTFNAHASLAEFMFNYDNMLKFSTGYLEIAKSKFDSSEACNLLKRAYFNLGNYSEAARFQKMIFQIDTTKATSLMAYGSYNLMAGNYPKALESFQKSKEIDTANQMINMNLALYYHIRDNDEEAKNILNKNLSNSKGAQAQGESRILLGIILNNSDQKTDLEKAADYFNQGKNIFTQSIQGNPSSPSLYLWCGIAYYGLYDYASALDYLHTAEFLETRPFYQGMINLWLGKTYLAQGEKESARFYFNLVSEQNSAAYHKEEALKYLNQ